MKQLFGWNYLKMCSFFSIIVVVSSGDVCETPMMRKQLNWWPKAELPSMFALSGSVEYKKKYNERKKEHFFVVIIE